MKALFIGLAWMDIVMAYLGSRASQPLGVSSLFSLPPIIWRMLELLELFASRIQDKNRTPSARTGQR